MNILQRIIQTWREDQARNREFEHTLPLPFKAARFVGGVLVYLLLLALVVRLELVIYYVYITQAPDLPIETAVPVGFVWGMMTTILGLWLLPELVLIILWPITNWFYRSFAAKRAANP